MILLPTKKLKETHCRQCPLVTMEAKPGHFFRRLVYENALTVLFLAAFGFMSIVLMIVGVIHVNI